MTTSAPALPSPAARSRRAPPPRPAPTSPLHGLSFQLASEEIVSTANPKWIQVCRAGTFKGYRGGGGPPFVITDQTLDTMVANLRGHPSFVAGVEALPTEEIGAKVLSGALGVTPFDIDHMHGPSEAWGLDLRRTPDPAGEPSKLEMLVYFLEPAYSWMLESRFRWTSIEWEENATHPVSGQKIGAYVSRVALTNDPFVQGMDPIQKARMLGGGGVPYDPWSPPCSADELLEALRRLFNLPEVSTLEAVLGAIASLRAWTSGGLPAPAGVDTSGLLGSLRLLLNLPTLSDSATIFGELDKLLAVLAAEQEEESEEIEPMSAKPGTEPTALLQTTTPEIVVHFAKRLQVEETEPAVTVAIDRKLTAGTDAMAMVDALCTALGTKDPKELAGKVAELVAIKARMDELLPQVEEMQAANDAASAEEVDGDVGAVMQSRGYPEELRDALLLQRKGNSADYFSEEKPVERQKKRAEARASFLRRYELSALDIPAQFRHLVGGRTLFAGPNAVYSPLGAKPAEGGGARPMNASGGAGAGGSPPPRPAGSTTWNDVLVEEGRNDGERCFAFVKRQDPKLGYDAAWARAASLRAELIEREGPCPS